jgi:uncharacterized membrane protein HdeD (DUF308 family)
MKSQHFRVILPAAACFAGALLCFLIPKMWTDVFVTLLGILGFIAAIPFAVHAFTLHRPMDLMGTALGIVLAVLAFFWHDNADVLISLIFGLYLILLGIIFLIQWVLDHFLLSEGIPALLYLIVGGLIAFFYRSDALLVQYVIGIYLFIQGWQLVWEKYLFSHNPKRFTFRHWAALPAYIVGFLPALVISRLQDRHLRHEPTHYDEKKNDEEVNFRIWIHTGTYATHLYGHMTYSCNGIMYSYGDYDVKAEKFFKSIGPGIFFTVNSEEYANNCCIVEHCPLFEFGLHLNEEQMAKFEEVTAQIMKDTTPWLCPLEQEYKQTGVLDYAKYEHDYSSRLWYRTKAQFRKYNVQPWKWYSLLGNNCSNFAAAKLDEIGLDLPIAKGVVSPGEFFEVLETAYYDPASPVISKAWHSAKAPETLFKTGD